ncbi:hypothetical protein V2I01_26195 [Micromonospora sp. BRA006-A]|nr:hypothetical protein [Micromonospora sp. BRA006-A]
MVNLLSYEDLNDVVLVGHSYAGAVVTTAVADRMTDRFAQLVFVDTGPLPDGAANEDLQPAAGRERNAALVAEHGDGWRLPPRRGPSWRREQQTWMNRSSRCSASGRWPAVGDCHHPGAAHRGVGEAAPPRRAVELHRRAGTRDGRHHAAVPAHGQRFVAVRGTADLALADAQPAGRAGPDPARSQADGMARGARATAPRSPGHRRGNHRTGPMSTGAVASGSRPGWARKLLDLIVASDRAAAERAHKD